MKALFITALILLFLLLVLQVRVKLLLRYEGTGCLLKLLWGPLQLTLYPLRPSKVQKKQKKPKVKKEKPEKPSDQKPNRTFTPALLREMLALALDSSGRMKRKLRIDDLMLRLHWGLEDPADTAISYGLAQAALGAMVAFVEVHFTVKKRQTEILLDYTLEKPQLVGRLLASITVWHMLAIGLRALWRVFGLYRAQKSKHANSTNIKKAVYDNGKESSHQ